MVTLDLDFSNPINFQPALYSGIAVLRLPKRANYQDLIEAIQTLIAALRSMDIQGNLWIIQRGNIRIYQEDA